ncbi:MAG: DUF4160 domain-containing protein [Candidatus Thioglobus sp.]|nr:DUF4160 domain-containing protein [Candidatus Thioglobus sp.]
MPEISRFFGIIIRMFYDEHNPPHFHAEYSGNKAVFDFQGNVIKGDLSSKTATKLVREWIDLHTLELENDWLLARKNTRDFSGVSKLNYQHDVDAKSYHFHDTI